MMTGRKSDVWEVQPGERRHPGVIHGVIALVLLILAIAVSRLCSFSLVLPLPLGKFMLTYFSPATTVQVVGGMWFGMWGVIAGMLFPVIGGFIGGQPLVVNLLLIPVNIVQSVAAVWVFRRWRRDPRLATFADWVVFILVVGLLMNIPAAIWVTAVYWRFGIASGSWIIFLVSYIIGHGLPPAVLGAVLLKAFSGVVVRSRVFCKGWWA
ncbi:MAG TPA: hypothetical protein EYH30_09240 [Anaerolineales bacterium]|nr:hypothetical protein [Anaerolineae bacterium]HIQ02291.1 hypothetical protein [Anaerolineales bacterium]